MAIHPKKKSPKETDLFVGGRVRLARVLANMSQEKLAAALKLSFQQVQKYEKGDNRIGASRLQDIATALNVPVKWFFGDESGPSETNTIIQQMLSAPYGVLLARAYLAIEHNQDRHVVLAVAQSLARHAPAKEKQAA